MSKISGIQVGDVIIYKDRLPDRKRPSLVVQDKGLDAIYGTFTNDEAAYEFFKILAELLRTTGGEERP